VSEVKNGKVELAMAHGELRGFDPSRLARNLSQDAVTIYDLKQIGLVTVWFRSLEIIYLTQGDGT
jgi:hypothetical protein